MSEEESQSLNDSLQNNLPQPRKYVSEFAPSQKSSTEPPLQYQPLSYKEKGEDTAFVETQTAGSLVGYAGFGRRFFAIFLDTIILVIIEATISLPVSLLSASQVKSTDSTFFANSLVSLVNLIIGLFYSLYFIGKKGQTPGKIALGIKVVNRETSQPPGYLGAFLREVVGKIISGTILGIGYLWMIWDKDKQTWHDKIAGTVVYKIK